MKGRRQQPKRVVKVGESRQLDNHFDHQIHHRAWISAGKTPCSKYNYGDSGLGVMSQENPKLKHYKMKYQLEQEVQGLLEQHDPTQHPGQPRPRMFREYEQIRENQILVTIEYCTNCEEHQSSTRHDSAKYLALAEKVKTEILSAFPVVKVFMKPLLMDHQDKSVNQRYLQKRLGAFEVQVCARLGGKVRCEVLFSKIESKKWPNVERDIINQLPSFLNQQSLIIQFFLDEDDQEQLLVEEDKETREKKFRHIMVTLRPVRKEMSYLKTEGSNPNNTTLLNTTALLPRSRPVSALNRPRSGKSTGSANKTLASLAKQLDSPFVSQSDTNGRVYFNNLPEDNYTMEMQETNDFLRETRQINMFAMLENNQPFFIKIPLQRQSLCFLKISLQYQQIFVNDACVEIIQESHYQAVLQQPTDNETGRQQIKESPPKSGKYCIELDPGVYRVLVTRKQFDNLNQVLYLNAGSNDLVLELKPQAEQRQHYQPQPQGRPQSGVRRTEKSQREHHTEPEQELNSLLVIRVMDAMTMKLMEVPVVLEQEGKPEREIQAGQGVAVGRNQEYVVRITKNGYQGMSQAVRVDTQSLYLTMPLFSLQMLAQNCVYLLVMAECQMHCITSDDTHHSQADFLEQSNSGEATRLIVYGEENLRVYAQLEQPHPQARCYVLLNKQVSCYQISQESPEGSCFWDIGFLIPRLGQMVEINHMDTVLDSEHLSGLAVYEELLRFIRNSKSVDIETILGFNSPLSSKIQNDRVITPEALLDSLDRYGFEADSIDKTNIKKLLQSTLMGHLVSLNKATAKLRGVGHVPFLQHPTQESNVYEPDDEYEEDI